MTKESDVFSPGDTPMVINTGMYIVYNNLSIMGHLHNTMLMNLEVPDDVTLIRLPIQH